MTAMQFRTPTPKMNTVSTIPLRATRYSPSKTCSKESFSPTIRKLSSTSSISSFRHTVRLFQILISACLLTSIIFVISAVSPSTLLTATSSFTMHHDHPIQSLRHWRESKFARSRLRIYIYELPSQYNEQLVEHSIKHPGPIRDPRCDTNFYSSEVHVHRYLLTSPVRTMNPEEADFFYVPVYTTCDLITHKPIDTERVGKNFQKAMDIVINEHPYWNRSNGRDHIYLFSQGHSARLAGDWHRINNGIFMVHNGEFTADEYTPHKDFTIAPELGAYLKPYWLQPNAALGVQSKKYLAQFGGQVINASVSDHRGSNYSGGVRQFIQAQFTDHPDYRITGVRSDTYLDDMRNSKFCLAPEGWHPWSPRPYYAVLMGCIPVVISEVQELAFEEFLNWDEFAVWIRPKDIQQLDTILRTFSNADIIRKQAAMQKVWQALWYGQEGIANEAILHSLYTRKYLSIPRHVFSHIGS